MTVASTTSAVSIPGTGSTATFPFTWSTSAPTDLVLFQQVVATGAITPLILNTDYTVSPSVGAAPTTGGTVTLLAGNLPTGTNLFICSDPAQVQTLLLQQGATVSPAAYMAALDYLTRCVQATRRVANNGIQIPLTESLAGLITTLPAAAQRAGKLAGFDNAGNVIATEQGALTSITAGVANVVALKALSAPVGGTIYQTTGYTSANDGGGGLYFWNASDTRTDNGGTIIALNGGGTGRFNLIVINNWVDARQFGAQAAGPVCTTNLQAALTTGYNLLIAGGTYLTGTLTVGAQQIQIASGATLQLNTGINAAMLSVTGNGATIFGRGTLNGNAGFQSAGDIIACTGNNLLVYDLTFIHAYRHAINVGTAAANITIRGNNISGCGGNGVNVTGTISEVLIADNVFSLLTGWGIYVNATAGSTGLVIRGNRVDRTSGATSGGIGVTTTSASMTDVTITENYCILPTQPASSTMVGISVSANVIRTQIADNDLQLGYDGLVVNDTTFATITGNTIWGVGNDGIRVQGGNDIAIVGNEIAGEEGPSNFGVSLEVDGGAVAPIRVAITGNNITAFGTAHISAVAGGGNLADVIISGNQIGNSNASAGQGIQINGVFRFAVLGNNFYTTGQTSIVITNPGGGSGTINGNTSFGNENGGHWLSVVTTSAITITDLVISGNTSDSDLAPILYNLFSGSSFGSGCMVSGNVEQDKARGSIFSTYRTVASASNGTLGDGVVGCDTTAGSFQFALPTNPMVGQQMTIIKLVAANTLTIGGTVNGSANPTLTTQYDKMTLVYVGGGGWLKVA